MKIKVGLVGLGNIGALYDANGQNVMSHLNAINQDKRYSLSFAYDPNQKNCFRAKEIYGISNIFNDLEQLQLSTPNVDLLVIASPTNCHLSCIETMLRFVTPKFILCEKPLAENVSDSEKISKLCNKLEIEIATNYMRRSLPVVQDLKKTIRSQFPSQHDIVIKYSGCFINNGSHFVDLMSFFYGFPRRIAHSSSEIDMDKNSKVRATVIYTNAVCNYIPLASNSVVDHEVEIMTNKFKLIIGRAGRDIRICHSCSDTDFPGSQGYGKALELESDFLNFQKYVYDDMFLAFLSGSLPANLCDIQTSLHNTKFIQELLL